jgi:hypothetical protein
LEIPLPLEAPTPILGYVLIRVFDLNHDYPQRGAADRGEHRQTGGAFAVAAIAANRKAQSVQLE